MQKDRPIHEQYQRHEEEITPLFTEGILGRHEQQGNGNSGGRDGRIITMF